MGDFLRDIYCPHCGAKVRWFEYNGHKYLDWYCPNCHKQIIKFEKEEEEKDNSGKKAELILTKKYL